MPSDMYMRLMWGKVRPGAWDVYEAKYKEVSRLVPGLRARWFVRDANDPDAVYTVALWDSIAAIRAWESSEHFNRVYVPSLKPFLVGEQSVSVCQVRHVEGIELR